VAVPRRPGLLPGDDTRPVAGSRGEAAHEPRDLDVETVLERVLIQAARRHGIEV
jgi:hypothetical protein